MSRTYTFQELIDSQVLEIGDGYRAKNSELGGSGLIFLRSGHVTDTHIDFSGVERFREPPSPQLNSKVAHPGDVIVTTKGWSTGRVSYVRGDMPPFVYSPHLSYWRSVDETRLSSAFLRHWSRFSECQSQLEQVKMAIDIHPYLSLATQRRLRVTLPPVSVQLAATTILDKIESKIELNRRTIETLEGIASAAFENAARSGTGRLVRLGEIFEINPPRHLQRGDMAPYLDMKGVPESGHRAAGWYPRRFESGSRFRNGDVLVARITPCLENGKTAYVDFLGDEEVGWGSTEFIVVRTRGSLHPYVSYLLARSEGFRTRAIQSMSGSTGRQRVQVDSLRDFEFSLPSATDSAALSKFLSAVVAAIRTRDEEMATLVHLRDGLLPKLISGELRIRDAAKSAARVA